MDPNAPPIPQNPVIPEATNPLTPPEQPKIPEPASQPSPEPTVTPTPPETPKESPERVATGPVPTTTESTNPGEPVVVNTNPNGTITINAVPVGATPPPEPTKLSEAEVNTVRTDETGDKVYAIRENRRYWVKNPETLKKMGFYLGQEKKVPFSELLKFNEGDPIDLTVPNAVYPWEKPEPEKTTGAPASIWN
jgi:hypothetical protein